MTKTLNQIIFFFLHQNQNIFFSNTGNQNIFLEKNHNPPFKLNGHSLINSGNSIDDLCESFSNVILQAAGESIPNKIITVRKTNPPWMNGAILRAIRK
jgi:hypothetical protein